MPIQLDDAELSSILNEVETELNVVFKNEAAKLKKAKEDGSDDDSGSSGDSGPPSGGDSGPPSGGDSSPAPDASAPPGGGSPPPDASASAPADPAASPDAGGGPMDVQSLKAAYSQLPDQELEMHYVACKAALMEKLQGQSAGGAAPPGASPAPDASAPPGAPPGGASPPPPAAPPGPPAGASPSPSAPPGPPDQSPPPAFKGEMSAGKQLNVAGPDANGGPVKKSENELKLEAQLAEQGQMIEGLAKAVDLVLGAPQRKAVTTLSSVKVLGKNESNANDAAPVSLSFEQAKAKLSEKARDPKLAKSDRILINKFCVREADQAQVAHLLK
jgi:hypothetical protein